MNSSTAQGAFVRFAGRTHFINPIGGAEHTLCGYAEDAAITENEPSLQ